MTPTDDSSPSIIEADIAEAEALARIVSDNPGITQGELLAEYENQGGTAGITKVRKLVKYGEAKGLIEVDRASGGGFRHASPGKMPALVLTDWQQRQVDWNERQIQLLEQIADSLADLIAAGGGV